MNDTKKFVLLEAVQSRFPQKVYSYRLECLISDILLDVAEHHADISDEVTATDVANAIVKLLTPQENGFQLKLSVGNKYLQVLWGRFRPR